MNPITLLEFAQAERQYSRTGHQEFMWASNLRCRRYTVPAQAFLGHRVFPVWRTSKDGTKYMGRFEDSRIMAFAITYATLATKPSVFPAITFDPAIDYFAAAAANPVIVYHCEGCGVHVVKDGSHRLLYCACHGTDRPLDIYQVSSSDWSQAIVDMRNFCSCPCFGSLPEAH